MPFLTEIYVIPISVDLICKHSFGIMPGAFAIVFQCSYQNIRFIVRIKGKFLQSCHAVFINTEIKLCTELCGSFRFASDYRTNVRLTDADNSVFNTVSFVLIHIELLLINLVYHIKHCCIFCRKFNIVLFEKPFNIAEIAVNIIQLLFDSTSYFFGRTLSAFCKCKIILSCVLTIHSRDIPVLLFAYFLDKLFQLFTSLVQQIYVLRIFDVLRCASCIYYQCSAVFGSIVFFDDSCFFTCAGVAAIIISLISIIMSALNRLRNYTSSDGTNGIASTYPGSPIK